MVLTVPSLLDGKIAKSKTVQADDIDVNDKIISLSNCYKTSPLHYYAN